MSVQVGRINPSLSGEDIRGKSDSTSDGTPLLAKALPGRTQHNVVNWFLVTATG